MALPVSAATVGITAAEMNAIGDETLRRKVIDALTQLSERNALNRHKVALEQQLHELRITIEHMSNDLTATDAKYREAQEEISRLYKERTSLQTQFNQAAHAQRLAECKQVELRSELEVRCTERDNHASLAETLRQRVADLERQLNESSERERTLHLEKFALHNRVDEVETLERELKARESRLKQEKELVDKECEWVKTELQRRDDQLRTIRSEQTQQLRDAEERTLELVEKVRTLEEECTRQQRRGDNLEKQMTDQTDELKDIKSQLNEERLARENDNRQAYELCEQLRTAADDADTRSAKAADALREQQSIIDELTQKCDELAAALNAAKAAHKADAEALGEEIKNINEELARANELLSSKNRVLLSDEEIAQLSPGAAQMSRILKANPSLTEMYQEYVKMRDQLEDEKAARANAERTAVSMTADLEQAIPMMERLRRRLDDAERQRDDLKMQLTANANDLRATRNEYEWSQRELTYAKQELRRVSQSYDDVKAQLTSILAVQEQRRLSTSANTSALWRSPDANTTIGDVSFRTAVSTADVSRIDEIVEENVKLKSELREAEERREELIATAQREQVEEMESRIAALSTDLELVQKRNTDQARLIETLVTDRDTWHRLYDEIKAETAAAGDTSRMRRMSMQSDTSRTVQNMTAGEAAQKEILERTEREFELYRNEAQEREKLHQAKIEALTNDYMKQKTLSARLETDLDYERQRFQTLCVKYDASEDKVRSLETSIEMHKRTESDLKKQRDECARKALELGEEKRRLEVDARMASDKVLMLDGQVKHLQFELSLERQQRQQNEKLEKALTELKNRAESTDKVQMLEKDAEIGRLKDECEQLRKDAHLYREQLYELSSDSKRQLQKANADRQLALASVETLQAELDNARQEIEQLKKELTTATDEVAQLKRHAQEDPSSLALGGGGRDTQLASRLRVTEQRLADLTKRQASTQAELERVARESAENAKRAQQLEMSLSSKTTSANECEARLRNDLTAANTQIEEINNHNASLSNDLSAAKARIEQMSAEHDAASKASGERIQHLERQLNESQQQNNEKEERLNKLSEECRQARATLEQINAQLNNARASNGQMSSENASLRGDIDRLTKELNEAQAAKQSAEQMLALAKQQHEQQLAAVEQAKAEIDERLKQKTIAFEDLTVEISTITNKMTIYETLALGSQLPSDTSFGVTGESAANEKEAIFSKLNEAMKHLREQCAEAQRRQNDAEEAANKLRAQEAQYSIVIAQKDTEIERLLRIEQQLSEVQIERAKLVDELGVLRTTADELATARADIVVLEQRIADTDSAIAEKQRELSDVRAELDTAQRLLADKDALLQSTTTELDMWRARHEKLMNERATIDPNEITHLRQQIGTAQARITELSNAASSDREKIDELTKKLQKAEMDLQTEAQRSVQLKHLGQKYRADTYKLIEQLRTAGVQIDDRELSEGTRKKLRAEAQETPLRDSANATAAPSFNADLAQLQQQLQSRTDELNAANERVSELEGECNELRQQVELLSKQLDEANEEIATFAAQVTELEKRTAEVQTLQGQLKEAQARCKSLECRIEMLAREYERLQQEQQPQASLASVSTTNAAITTSAVPIVASVPPTTKPTASRATAQRVQQQATVPPQPQQSASASRRGISLSRPTRQLATATPAARMMRAAMAQVDASSTSISEAPTATVQPQHITSSTTATGTVIGFTRQAPPSESAVVSSASSSSQTSASAPQQVATVQAMTAARHQYDMSAEEDEESTQHQQQITSSTHHAGGGSTLNELGGGLVGSTTGMRQSSLASSQPMGDAPSSSRKRAHEADGSTVESMLDGRADSRGEKGEDVDSSTKRQRSHAPPHLPVEKSSATQQAADSASATMPIISELDSTASFAGYEQAQPIVEIPPEEQPVHHSESGDVLPEGVDEEYNEEGEDNDSAVLIEQIDDEEQPESPEALEVDGGAIVAGFDEDSLGVDGRSQQNVAEESLRQPEALTTLPVATIEEPPSDFSVEAQGEDAMLDENVGESGEQIERAPDRIPSADDSQAVPPTFGGERSADEEEGDTGETASDEGEPDDEYDDDQSSPVEDEDGLDENVLRQQLLAKQQPQVRRPQARARIEPPSDDSAAPSTSRQQQAPARGASATRGMRRLMLPTAASRAKQRTPRTTRGGSRGGRGRGGGA